MSCIQNSIISSFTIFSLFCRFCWWARTWWFKWHRKKSSSQPLDAWTWGIWKFGGCTYGKQYLGQGTDKKGSKRGPRLGICNLLMHGSPQWLKIWLMTLPHLLLSTVSAIHNLNIVRGKQEIIGSSYSCFWCWEFKLNLNKLVIYKSKKLRKPMSWFCKRARNSKLIDFCFPQLTTSTNFYLY